MDKNNGAPLRGTETCSLSYRNGPGNSRGTRHFTGPQLILASPLSHNGRKQQPVQTESNQRPIHYHCFVLWGDSQGQGRKHRQGCLCRSEFTRSRAQAGIQLLIKSMILPSAQPHWQPMQRKKRKSYLTFFPSVSEQINLISLFPCSLTGSLLIEVLAF